MRLKNYALQQSFESIGMWMPDYKQLDQAVSGILKVANQQVTLKLFGLTHHFKNKRMVYGYTQDGKLIWVPNFQGAQAAHSDSRFAVREYLIEDFYVFEVEAEHFNGTNMIGEAFHQIFQNSRFDFQIHQLAFSTNHLLDWMGQKPYHFNEKQRSELHIPYDIVKSEQFKLPNQLSLQLDLKQNVLEERTKIVVESAAEVTIRKQNGTKSWFQKLLKEAESFVKLLDFLGGWVNVFDYLQFEIQPGIRGRYIFHQGPMKSPHTSKEVHTTFLDLEHSLEKVLLNYVHKRNKLDLVLDDYLSEFYLMEFHETKLLNSIRNLEIFHRNFIEPRERVIQDEGVEAAREQIIAYINQEVPEKYQGRFRSQVYYQPEKSLRKRMDFLIKALPDDVFTVLSIKSPNRRKSRSIGSFVNRLVETRHYFTHGDFPENYPHRFTEWDQVKRANQTLRKICLYYVYKELGINEKIILKKITSSA